MFRLTARRTFSSGAALCKPNPANIIGGHKATLKNPNASEEAKAHSREVLDREFDGGDTAKYSTARKGEHNPKNIEGGLKAAINNPNTGEEARERAKERLGEQGH
ncbi:hypothetical protein EDC01DRAFT_791066 [Geopyxis carbonaria]|nr:hypothetical protein EDC01DRAFT_791066 [Geopyxis carbonaria]